jgi:hypothetical protein
MSALASRRRLASALVVGRLLPIYLAFAALKHLLPLRVLARLAWRAPREVRDIEAERRVVGRIIPTARLAGRADRDCLQRSLLIYHALSKAGADPVLVVGFSKSERRLRGHAWVVTDGRVVAESAEHVSQFEEVFQFGAGGRLRHGSLACPPC